MHLSIFIILLSISVSAQKTYQKTYFENGDLKNEGWIKDHQKVGFWKFYYPNRNLKKKRNIY